MGGKFTNIIFGISSIFLSILLCFYTYMVNVNMITFTKYENMWMVYIKYALFVFVILNTLISVIYKILKRDEKNLSNSYLINLLSVSFIFYQSYLTSIFSFLAGICIIYFVLKKNFVEHESFISIVISWITIILMFGVFIGIIQNSKFALIFKNRDLKDIVEYDSKFFSLVEPLEKEEKKYAEKWFNLKRDNKFGYLDFEGNNVIGFEYDFATPFYKINVNNKEYLIAGVTKGEITEVILKNKRIVMSYKSEYEIYDYAKRIEEFKKVIKENINSSLKPEIEDVKGYLKDVKIYPKKNVKDDNGDKLWTYKYDYSDKYDVIVIESELGEKNKYYLVNKSTNNKKELLCDDLIYDDKSLKVFAGGEIPYFSLKRQEKFIGYFEPDGNRKKLEGKAKIIYVEKDRILIKNEVKKAMYFIDNVQGKEVSPIFKEVIVDEINERYIVKNNNDKWTILNKKFERVFEQEYDIVRTDFLNYGIYIFANIPENFEINEYGYLKLDYLIVKSDGKAIASSVNFFGEKFKQYTEDKIVNKKEEIKEELTKSDVVFFGEKFYK